MSKKTITVKSSDGELFEVDEAVELQLRIVENIHDEDDRYNKEHSLKNVKGKILAKVIEYCKKHHVDGSSSSSSGVDLRKWDAEFINVDKSTIFELIHAADHLNIKCLLVLAWQRVEDMFKGKNAEEIREHFNIKKDFTPEQKEEIRAHFNILNDSTLVFGFLIIDALVYFVSLVSFLFAVVFVAYSYA